MPKLRHVAIALAALVGFMIFSAGIDYLFPAVDQASVLDSEVVEDEYESASTSSLALMLWWVSVVVIAPITEEITFRGFLFRGWSESWLGAFGAIVLTSLIFGAMHMQYTWQGMLSTAAWGLMLGIARWRSGSTILTIMMHAAWNLSGGMSIAFSA
jgi:membrane protease YdiL (CAAX protease family)